MSQSYKVEIAKRPWYEWVLWGVWLFLEIFILQNALTSSSELEPRAAALFWGSFLVLLLVGVTIWFLRRARMSK